MYVHVFARLIIQLVHLTGILKTLQS